MHWEDPEESGGDGGGRGGSGWGIHVTPWLIHVNVWQKPLQYCRVISLQLIKINEKKIKKIYSLRYVKKKKRAGREEKASCEQVLGNSSLQCLGSEG